MVKEEADFFSCEKDRFQNLLLIILHNPVIISAFCCAVLIYSGLFVPRTKNAFVSLMKLSAVKTAEGFIVSNPSKVIAGDSYFCDFEATAVCSGTGFRSQAHGNIRLLIPSSIIESLYPQKLYTVSGGRGGFLLDKGAYVSLSGSLSERETFFVVEKVDSCIWNDSLVGKILHFRALCRLQLRRLLCAWGKAGGLLIALLSGCREYTEENLFFAFRDAGLSHILALSGMHLTLIGGIVLFWGTKLLGKKSSQFLLIFFIIFFVWFAGASPSLFRAFLYSLVYFLCYILHIRKPSGLQVLCLVFLIHAYVFPEHLLQIAFMLSYAALAGILICSPVIKRFFLRFIIPLLKEPLAASVGAQLFTAPISLAFFGKIVPIGIIATLAVSPLITVFLYIGLLGIALCLFMPFLSEPFNGIMNMLYNIISHVVLFFAGFPAFCLGM